MFDHAGPKMIKAKFGTRRFLSCCFHKKIFPGISRHTNNKKQMKTWPDLYLRIHHIIPIKLDSKQNYFVVVKNHERFCQKISNRVKSVFGPYDMNRDISLQIQSTRGKKRALSNGTFLEIFDHFFTGKTWKNGNLAHFRIVRIVYSSFITWW